MATNFFLLLFFSVQILVTISTDDSIDYCDSDELIINEEDDSVSMTVPDEESIIFNVIDNDEAYECSRAILYICDYEKASYGEVVQASDKTFEYTPNTGFCGVDAFSYKVTDKRDPDCAHHPRATVSVSVTGTGCPGDSCSNDDDCLANNCNDDDAICGSLGADCTDDVECSDNAKCSTDNLNNEMRCGFVSAKCTTHDDCLFTDRCCQGRCGGPGCYCTANADCAFANCAYRDACGAVGKACSKTDECIDGYICMNSKCKELNEDDVFRIKWDFGCDVDYCLKDKSDNSKVVLKECGDSERYDWEIIYFERENNYEIIVQLENKKKGKVLCYVPDGNLKTVDIDKCNDNGVDMSKFRMSWTSVSDEFQLEHVESSKCPQILECGEMNKIEMGSCIGTIKYKSSDGWCVNGCTSYGPLRDFTVDMVNDVDVQLLLLTNVIGLTGILIIGLLVYALCLVKCTKTKSVKYSSIHSTDEE